MKWKRPATFGLIGAALAAWLAAAATTGTRDVAPPPTIRTPPIDTRGEMLATEISRLHDHLRPTATPRQPSRNLFTFASRQPRAVQPVAPPLPPSRPPALIEPPPPSAPPPVSLSGIAEDRTPEGGTVRTAILSAAGQLFVVKE